MMNGRGYEGRGLDNEGFVVERINVMRKGASGS